MIAPLFLVAATAGASPPQARPTPATPLVQATATARIVQGERISADSIPRIATVTETHVRGPDGVERDARLVEFT